MVSADSIHFHYLTEPFAFTKRTRLKEFLAALFKNEGKELDTVNYVFCDDAYLFQLNREYLNHNTYTDIITFELNPKNQPLLSDIYISIDRVRSNAGTFKVSFKQELHRVIFHGALHLCGYKDKSEKDSRLMRKKEEECLRNYFVPRGTIKL